MLSGMTLTNKATQYTGLSINTGILTWCNMLQPKASKPMVLTRLNWIKSQIQFCLWGLPPFGPSMGLCPVPHRGPQWPPVAPRPLTYVGLPRVLVPSTFRMSLQGSKLVDNHGHTEGLVTQWPNTPKHKIFTIAPGCHNNILKTDSTIYHATKIMNKWI